MKRLIILLLICLGMSNAMRLPSLSQLRLGAKNALENPWVDGALMGLVLIGPYCLLHGTRFFPPTISDSRVEKVLLGIIPLSMATGVLGCITKRKRLIAFSAATFLITCPKLILLSLPSLGTLRKFSKS